VPFYLRTGKRLPKRTTEIAIQFHRPPLQIFKRVSRTPLGGRNEPVLAGTHLIGTASRTYRFLPKASRFAASCQHPPGEDHD
jgi:hypothetical protein